MKIRNKVMFGLLSSLLSVAAVAQAASYSKASRDKEGIFFKTKAVAGIMTIEGSMPFKEIKDASGAISITGDISKLTTGMTERDDHAKSTLKKNTVVFKLNKDHAKKGKHSVTGKLTLGGVTKDTTVQYQATGGKTINVTGVLSVNLKDFGIEPPCRLGVCVADKTDVVVKFAVTENP